MIAIDWIFIGGASGIVGVALLDKLSEEYGYRGLGRLIKALLPIAGTGAILSLCNALWEVFLR